MTKTPGLRQVTKEDLAGIHSLLQQDRCKFHLGPILSVEEVEHWFFSKENVIDTYVVEVKFNVLIQCVYFHIIIIIIIIGSSSDGGGGGQLRTAGRR